MPEAATAIENRPVFQPSPEAVNAKELYFKGKLIEDPAAAKAALAKARETTIAALAKDPTDQGVHVIAALVAVDSGEFDAAAIHVLSAPDRAASKIFLNQDPDLLGDKLSHKIGELEGKKAAGDINEAELKELALLTAAAHFREYTQNLAGGPSTEPIIDTGDATTSLEPATAQDIDEENTTDRIDLAAMEMQLRLGRALLPEEITRIKKGARSNDILFEAGIDPYSKPLPYPGKPGVVTRIPVGELEENGVNYLPSQHYEDYRSVYDPQGNLYRLLRQDDDNFIVQRLSKEPGEPLITGEEEPKSHDEFREWRMETTNYLHPEPEPEPKTNMIKTNPSWKRFLTNIIRKRLS